ncbi:uncharacterized protein EV154DRAFT_420991 [Mucor mucedo]|uniref:uncharacterized protein n=1 Tax=Mucor mucedo TaxID=29922 RepID=UPI002220B4E9|nr:uncharacterized protein EV154DRAFT_420991 [Mucor mucedo]KAI7891096.1 hypothetical protein EV154DRAFT_420991 [Mucor mucedo]
MEDIFTSNIQIYSRNTDTNNKRYLYQKGFKRFWSLPIPPPARNLWYRILSRKSPTSKYLNQIGTIDSPRCHLCHNYVDNLEHFIVQCTIKSTVWNRVLTSHYPTYNVTNSNILKALYNMETPFGTQSSRNIPFLVIISTTNYYIWYFYWQFIIHNIPFVAEAIINRSNRQISIILN